MGPLTQKHKKVNSKKSFVTATMIPYAYRAALVSALLDPARWQTSTQRLITLFIYYHFQPVADNTINLANLS